MNMDCKAFTRFLDKAHSVYHTVAEVGEFLEKAGYQVVSEGEKWELVPGGKYYLIRGESALVAFRVPKGTPLGFMMSGSHADRPCFKLKENGELTDKYTRLATEKYGGMLIAPWMDRPLSLAGRVVVEAEDGIQSRLVDIDRDLLLIPSVAIHMNRKANEGVSWNPAVDTLPLAGSETAHGRLWELLEQEAGGKVLGHDLYLYIRQKASVWGVDEEYVSAAGLDDLACVWCCTQGFVQSAESQAIPVLCVFDSEEVGSATVQGAGSTFLEDVLDRVCRALGLETKQLLHRSFMVSADNAHGLHPNHPEYADSNNAPMLGAGVVVKFNANQRYTTDGVSAAIFRKVCQKAGVPVQTYYNRADLSGGSTLGCISLSHVSVPTVDIGLAQLAMHSCYETAGLEDVSNLRKAMAAFYGSTLSVGEDGYIKIK